MSIFTAAMKTISLKTLSQLHAAAKEILSFAGNKKIFCFYGDLGAGKTTLIKEMCRQLGVKDAGSSPTFSLINEYSYPSPRSPQRGESQSEIHPRPTLSPLGTTGGWEQSSKRGGETVFHFDLYRLKSESEIYDIGYEDYIFSGNYCFIEWPLKIERLLPANHVKVQIEVKEGERIIRIS